mmetsp:Transcript_135860/g.352290  ORF Transcript_135860/g.352290 Transcript_135860/m.352290 type:complete len:409 (-) Transcript_135860:347-1573(-)
MASVSISGGLFDFDALDALEERSPTGEPSSSGISSTASCDDSGTGESAAGEGWDLAGLDVTQVETELSTLNVDTFGCTEKQDFVGRLEHAGGWQVAAAGSSPSPAVVVGGSLQNRGEPGHSNSSAGGGGGGVGGSARVGAATDSGAAGGGREIAGPSVKEIKAELSRLGVDASGYFEKKELIALLEKARGRQFAAIGSSPTVVGGSLQSGGEPGHPSSSGGASGGDSTFGGAAGVDQDVLGLSVRELKTELVRLGVDASGCVEKAELVAALKQAGWRHLPRCPICLDGVKAGGPDCRSCDGCRAGFHRRCAAGHALAAAEEARLPLLCPACRRRWNADMVQWALDEAELQRYNALVRRFRERRQRSAASSNLFEGFANAVEAAAPFVNQAVDAAAPFLRQAFGAAPRW